MMCIGLETLAWALAMLKKSKDGDTDELIIFRL